MTSSGHSDRQYNDREIGKLIQRATELHEAEEGSTEHSLSLKDVEQIARDLGVSSEHVQAAAQEMDLNAIMSDKFTLFGGPFREQYSHVVEGELNDAQWEDIVLELRRITGGSGKTTQIGRIREWSRIIKDMDMTLHGLQVTLRPNRGETTIDLEKHFGILAFFTFLMSGVGGFVLFGAFVSALGVSGPLAFTLAMMGGLITMSTARAIFSLWRKKHRKRLQAYAQVIASKIQTGPDTSRLEETDPVALEETDPVALEEPQTTTSDLLKDLDEENLSSESEASRTGERSR